MFNFFKKKKPAKHAVSKRIDNVVVVNFPKVNLIKDDYPTYINHLIRLRMALLTGNEKMRVMLQEKYLPSVGLKSAQTISECDDMIEEIKAWISNGY